MASLTSANAVLLIGVNNLYTAPQQLQGFAADDVYGIEEIEPVESVMGVDGVMSAGFVYRQFVQNIFLQDDSASNVIFDNWYQAQQAVADVYFAFGSITLNSLGSKYTMTRGTLARYTPAPEAKRVLQRRRYTIHWNKIIVQPSNTQPSN